MKKVKLGPLDVPYLAKCGGSLKSLSVEETAKCIRNKGSGGPNSYEPIIRKFGELSSGKLNITELCDTIDDFNYLDFSEHLKAGARGFAAMLRAHGGVWRHLPPEDNHLLGGLSTQTGVRGVWLHNDFRRACILNLRATESLSADASGFLLRACYEIFVRDQPSVSEPCVVDLSMENLKASKELPERKANILTPKNTPMMDIEEYEEVLSRFWVSLELANVVPEGAMPSNLSGTLFMPDMGLFRR